MAAYRLKTFNLVLLFAALIGGYIFFKMKTDTPPAELVPIEAVPTTPPTPPTPPAPPDADHTTPAEIPAFVSDQAIGNLMKRHPQIPINQVKWEERHYGFEAIFTDNNKQIEVEYDKNGNWLETEFEHVAETDIPYDIRQKIATKFPKASVEEYEIEHTAQGTFYEVELNEDGKHVEKYFDSKGDETTNTNEDS